MRSLSSLVLIVMLSFGSGCKTTQRTLIPPPSPATQEMVALKASLVAWLKEEKLFDWAKYITRAGIQTDKDTKLVRFGAWVYNPDENTVGYYHPDRPSLVFHVRKDGEQWQKLNFRAECLLRFTHITVSK